MECLIKNVIKINEEGFIYRGKLYSNYDILREMGLIKRAVILILEHNIYIRKFNLNSNFIGKEEIKRIKKSEFGLEEEYLINYEICKKEKKLYMYAIGGGRRISYIAEKLKEIKVIPIQMYIRDLLKRKIKDDDYQCLFFYSQVYYYINVHNSYIIKCYLWKNINEVIDFFNKRKSRRILYVQEGIEIEYDNIIFVDFGGIYDKKIFI